MYKPEEILVRTDFGLLAIVLHEHRGFTQFWPAELELLRVIIEKSVTDGEDYRPALDGRTSYWRWRDWIVALARPDVFDDKGMEKQMKLMNNMLTINLPDSFSQLPTPVSGIIGES